MITASVGMNSSLLLEPAHQLTFWLDAQNPQVSSACARATLRLTNISRHKLAVFKVRTNNADMFTVKPVHGAIPPGEAREITITVVATSAARLAAMDPAALAARNSERFLIQSVERADDTRGFDVSDLVAFWKRVPRELATNSKIGCRFAVMPSGMHHEMTSNNSPVVRRCVDTISKSPQPVLQQQVLAMPPMALQQQQQQSPEKSEPSEMQQVRHRLSFVQVAPRDIDKTIDVRDAHRRKTSSAQQDTPDAFESSSSSESNDSDNDRPNAAPAADPIAKPRKALFSIHPSDNTVEFHVKSGPGPAVLSSASFFLTNKSRTHALAFKVKTTNHEGYFVKPSRGLIGPSNAQQVEILPADEDQAQQDVDDTLMLQNLQQREAKDRFMVEIVRVDIANYQELLNLDEKVRKRELFAIWDSAEPASRDKALLSCRITDLPLTRKLLMKHQQQMPRNRLLHDNQDEHDTWC